MKRIEKKITLGRGADGNFIRKSVYGKTKAEVERKAFAVRQQWLEKAAAPREDMTMITYARRWYDQEKSMRSVNTREMYFNVIEKHLVPALDELYFHEITQADLQGIINLNFEKYETCNKIRMTLRQIYAAAVEEGMEIPKGVNPKKLVLPQKPASNKRALTDEEKYAVTHAELTDRQQAFLFVLYYCGLRREEALALDASAFDFKKKQLYVKQALVFDHNAGRIQRTKNAYSVRIVPLPDACVKQLSGYVKGKDLLFTLKSDINKPMSHSAFVKFWSGIQKALLPLAPTADRLTPHIFRHNYATMLYYSDVSPKMAARLMGHADITMIMRVYAHIEEEKEQTADKLNRIFGSAL